MRDSSVLISSDEQSTWGMGQINKDERMVVAGALPEIQNILRESLHTDKYDVDLWAQTSRVGCVWRKAVLEATGLTKQSSRN